MIVSFSEIFSKTTKLHLSSLMLVLSLLNLSSEIGVGQTVCQGSTEFYSITPNDEGNSFQWSITPGTAGVDWIIDSENSPETNIEWLVSGIYTLTFTETGSFNLETSYEITVTATPEATINYSGSSFCTAGTATVTLNGPGGGTYSSTNGLSIDPSSGAIDLAASIPDTYMVTYSFSVGTCSNIATTSITINGLPDAFIEYPGSPYCATGSATVTQTGTSGGTYSSSAGLIINSTSGAINLATSTPGIYTVIYSFSDATCSNTTSTLVTISVPLTANINYPGSPFCTSGTAEVIQSGEPGGTYSSDPGLIIDLTTGTIDLAASTPGTYTVNYSYSNGICSYEATTSVIVNDQPVATISYTGITACSTGTASVTLEGTYTSGTFSSTEGLSIDPGTGNIDLDSSTPGTYTVTFSFSDGRCSNTASTGVTVNAQPVVPAAAGIITGPLTFTRGDAGVAYSVGTIDGAVSYIWTYTGSGVTINGTGTNVTLTFSSTATEGLLTVRGRNLCGDGTGSSIQLRYSTRTLNLTSLMLQGLYDSGGRMRQAFDEFGPHWPAGVADHITVELHSASNYSVIIHTSGNVPLNTTGTATILIPSVYAASYYITVKHRNSVETTTSIPVSFSGSTISQSFGLRANVYGGNLGVSSDGHFLIYGGDTDQDGFIGVSDMAMVDNQSAAFGMGYLVEDIDGDGFVGVSDMAIVDNNSANFIYAVTP